MTLITVHADPPAPGMLVCVETESDQGAIHRVMIAPGGTVSFDLNLARRIEFSLVSSDDWADRVTVPVVVDLTEFCIHGMVV